MGGSFAPRNDDLEERALLDQIRDCLERMDTAATQMLKPDDACSRAARSAAHEALMLLRDYTALQSQRTQHHSAASTRPSAADDAPPPA